MATRTIERMLPLTAAYINSSFRAGHHNRVITQDMLNSTIALADMDEDGLKEFDFESFKRLRSLDDCIMTT